MKRVLISLIVYLEMLIAVAFSFADIRLNMEVSGDQDSPSSAKLSNGNMVVAWSQTSSVADTLIAFNFIQPDTTRLYFWEQTMTNQIIGFKPNVKLAASADGFFVAAYTRSYAGQPEGNDIFIRKYDNSGSFLSSEIRLNDDTLGQQRIKSLILDDEQDFIIGVWSTSIEENPELRQFYMRRFDFNIGILSEDILIYQGYDEILSFDIAQISDTRLMETWAYDNPETFFYDIKAKCFNLYGNDTATISNIHQVSDEQFWNPAIVRIPGDGALVVWAAMFDQYDASIWGRRFDTLGAAIDLNPVLLSCPDTNGGNVRIQQHPCIACDMTSGRYFLSWVENTDLANPWNHILGRFFNSSLEPITDTFQINDSPSYQLSSPIVSFWSSDTVFVAWNSYIDDYYQTDVFGDIVLVPDISIESDQPQSINISLSAYPNPFNSTICLKVPAIQGEYYKLDIYDILGRCVKSFNLNSPTVPEQQIIWDAEDNNGIEVASGIYFVRLQGKTNSETRKINLIR